MAACCPRPQGRTRKGPSWPAPGATRCISPELRTLPALRSRSQRRQAFLHATSMAHLFVTGAAGWLGLNLLEFLRGPKVAATVLEFDGITALLHPQDTD